MAGVFLYISSFLFFFFSHRGKGIAENCQSLIVFCVGRRFGKGIKENSPRNDMEGGDSCSDGGFPKQKAIGNW